MDARPMLDLDVLRTLVAIADAGSFSAAGGRVARTPSAVSMQVKKAEETLGATLFRRDSRSVEPTPDGAWVIEHGRRMLSLDAAAMARFVTPDVAGVVRLGAPCDVAEPVLPRMLAAFATSHPGVTVDVLQDTTARMQGAMAAGDLDLILETLGEDEAPATDVLFREDLVWGMRRGGVAVERRPLPVSAWNATCAWRRAAEAALAAQGRDWRLAFQSAQTAGQRAAVLADLAVAPLPASALGGDVVRVPARHGLPPLPSYVLALRLREGAPAPVRAAADHLRAAFGALAAGELHA